MISVTRLVKTFGRRGTAVDAVRDVSFEIDAGEFIGYVGPNGAGKSTTIKMMCGVLVPTSGTVVVDGLVPWKDRRKLNHRLGVVFGQRTQLWWDLPLRDSVRLIGHLYRVPNRDVRARVDELHAVLGIGELLDRPVRTLSLGQRMRAELAVAVLPRPSVLFLDEPTIGLDVEAKAAVRTFLGDLNRRHGTTILLTTHDLSDIEELCRRMMIIDHGQVIYDGTVTGLRDTYATTRHVVVDLRQDDIPTINGATCTRSEARRHWLEFPKGEGQAARIIGDLVANYDVADLTLEEPNIEDIVRQIYRDGRVPGQQPPQDVDS